MKNGKGNKPNVAVIVIIIVVLAFAITIFSTDSKSKYDVAHDPDGFLGYSDSFWEWYADNN